MQLVSLFRCIPQFEYLKAISDIPLQSQSKIEESFFFELEVDRLKFSFLYA